MKNFSLKIACVFIILMYCLAPLSALDLNQDDNNNKYIKQDASDSGIETQEVDVAKEKSDEQSKNLDDSDSVDSKDLDTDSVDVKNREKTTEDKDSAKLAKAVSPLLTIHVNDVHVGEKASAEVHAVSSFSGTVYVYLKGSVIPYSVQVKNGYGKVTFKESLPAGTYTARVKYCGSLKYKADESTTTFKVSKYSPNLSIKVDDVNIGEKATAKINADESFSGTVYVYLKGSSLPYAVQVKNGHGQVTFKEPLPAGAYTATVKYCGSCKYMADESSTSFNVNKFDPNLSIKVDDINLGEKATVEISADESFTGYVYVSFHGDLMPHKVYVRNGHAEKTIDEDLEAGTYTATVKFAGDNKFNPSLSSTTFKVKANLDPNLGIKVDDITEGQKAVVVVTADESLNGEASVWLNHSNAVYPVSIVDGSGSVTIDEDLALGDYLATVSFAGDDTYKADMKSTTFAVREKATPNLSIKVDDITEGDKAVAVVSADKSLNGDAHVFLNNSNAVYPVSIVDGSGSVTIDEDLAPGDYLATVSFAGDDSFKADENSTSFKVSEKVPELIDPDLNIKVKNISYGDKTTITVTTNAKFTGNVDVKVGSSSYNVKLVNGKGTKDVSGLKVGTYTAKATFKQTEIFKASTKSTKFTVKKANLKLIAKSKTFKYSQKTKKYSVTLKDNKGKAVKGKKLTLKVNGKTYSAKTNAKGVATFKITKLNKVATNNAVVTYAGDKSYNKVSKKAKITVKFDAISSNSKNRLMVKKIQRALKRNHFYIRYNGHRLLVDGWYHIYTKWAVKKYQKAHGLKVTGKVDYRTALKLKLI